MNQDQIRQRYKIIDQFQEKWALEEKNLQELCTHPNVEKKYKGNTGNYDPTADCYWIEFKCPDCQKRWKKYQ